MTFKKLLSYFVVPFLVIGACTTLGFLTFSGVWTLLPFLPLSISAFMLSIGFEGEIYYQNIKDALGNILNPDYVQEQLAKECLKEIMLCFEIIYKANSLIDAIDEHLEQQNSREANYPKILRLANDIQNLKLKVNKINPSFLENVLPQSQFSLPDVHYFPTQEEINNEINTPFSFVTRSATKKKLIEIRDVPSKKKLMEIRDALSQELRTVNQSFDFFKNYAEILNIHHQYAHKNLNPEDAKNKKILENILSILEKTFTKQLFTINNLDQEEDPDIETVDQDHPYTKELKTFLQKNYQRKWDEKLQHRNKLNIAAKIFSAVSGIFMILGNTYLLIEAFEIVPFLSAIPFGILPVIIVPMSVIAGTAFAVLTYNALDELIHDDLIQKRITKISEDFKLRNFTLYKGFKALMFLSLMALSATLTVFTAGTWLTIINNTKPLFSFLGKIPPFLTKVIAIGLGAASYAFTVSNSAQTMEECETLFESEPENNQIEAESWWQFLNPFRAILLVTYLPLRFLLFLGHLVSISATADRVPGINGFTTALFGFVAEFFEDLHYFASFKHAHKHDLSSLLEERFSRDGDHDHANDLPTRMLRDYIFYPIFYASAWWHSADIENETSFNDILDKEMGKGAKETITPIGEYTELLNIFTGLEMDSDDVIDNQTHHQSLLSNLSIWNRDKPRITRFSFCEDKSCSLKH